MTDSNSEDVRNINEGDTVTLETTEGDTITAECYKTVRQNAKDPEIVRETRQWHFMAQERELMVQIIDGLRRFEDQAPYAHHTPLCVPEENGESFGYIESVKIHGKMKH